MTVGDALKEHQILAVVRADEFDDLAARLPAEYREDLLSTSATNS